VSWMLKKADVQMTASRLGLLLLESWKGGGASDTYNPAAVLSSQFSTFETSASGPTTPSGFTALPTACYHIVANDNIHYYAQPLICSCGGYGAQDFESFYRMEAGL